jgi:hypothetical protein
VLEAVLKFPDTVDGCVPDVGEDRPRRKVIDSAFEMAEQLVASLEPGCGRDPEGNQ